MTLLPPVRLSCCRCQLLGDGALPVQPLFELLDGVPAVIIFVLLRRIQEENNRMGGGPSLDQSGGGPFRAQCEIALHCQRRSEEHTSELQSLMRISYAVFCLKKKKKKIHTTKNTEMNNNYTEKRNKLK